MRFQCDHCQSRYAIPDERVVGRVLKIRCKRCREVIEVVGPPAPGASDIFDAGMQVRESTTAVEKFPDVAALSVDDELEHRSSGVHFPKQISRLRATLSQFDDDEQDAKAIWWAAIDGQRVGPLARKDLRLHARRGRVCMETLVWRKGLSGWQRVDKVKDLRAVRAAVRERDEALRRPRRVTGMESGVFATTGLFDASALAQALRDQGVVSLETKINTTQLAQDDKTSAEQMQATQHDDAATCLSDDEPPPLQQLDSAQVQGSDWYVMDERLQAGLWQDLPADFPAGLAAVSSAKFLPRRQRLKAAVAVAALLSLFIGGLGFAAWLTRDGLTQLAGAPSLPQLRDRSPYIPDARQVDSVRRALMAKQIKQAAAPLVYNVSGAPILVHGATQPVSAQPVPAQLDRARQPDVDSALAPSGPIKPAAAKPAAAKPGSDENDSEPDVASAPNMQAQAPRVPGLKPNTAVDPVARGLQALQDKAAKSPAAQAPMRQQQAAQNLPQALTPMDVMRELKRHRAQLKSCQLGLADDGEFFAGGVETSLLVARDGRVHQVRVAANGPGAQALQRCFTRVMSGWRFQPPDSELEVVLPITF